MEQEIGFWVLDAIFIFAMAFLGSKLSNRYVRENLAPTFKNFICAQFQFLIGVFLGYILFFGAHITLRGGFIGVTLAFSLLASLVLLVLVNFGISFCLYRKRNLDSKSLTDILLMTVLIFVGNLTTYFLMVVDH